MSNKSCYTGNMLFRGKIKMPQKRTAKILSKKKGSFETRTLQAIRAI